MLDTKRQRKYAGSQPVLCKAFYIKIAPALYLHFIFYIDTAVHRGLHHFGTSPNMLHSIHTTMKQTAARLRAFLRASKGGCI